MNIKELLALDEAQRTAWIASATNIDLADLVIQSAEQLGIEPTEAIKICGDQVELIGQTLNVPNLGLSQTLRDSLTTVITGL